MKHAHDCNYEQPANLDILANYIHKNAFYSKAEARKIKRTLRKLRLA